MRRLPRLPLPPGPFRFTIRARLTLAFTMLIAVAGAVMVAVVNTFMRTVPSYEIAEGTPRRAFGSPLPTADAIDMSTLSPIALYSAFDILNASLVVSVVVLALIIIVGALIAWLIAGRILRPLQAINNAAHRASTGTLHHRLGLLGPRDELRDLSETFDLMLERLEHAFHSHQRFAANASHELRTPLAITQTILEVGLSDPELKLPELRGIAQQVMEANRRNIETVDALLDLAEIGHRPISEDPIDLTVLVQHLHQEISAEADQRHLTVTTSLDPACTHGDAVLLRQAIKNLLLNGVRHNNDGGHLQIALRTAHEHVHLQITNDGTPITNELIHRMTEPFIRGNQRTATTPNGPQGHGLGLALVMSIVRAHSGTLDLIPRSSGGLSAFLTLPQAPKTAYTLIHSTIDERSPSTTPTPLDDQTPLPQ